MKKLMAFLMFLSATTMGAAALQSVRAQDGDRSYRFACIQDFQ